MTCGTCADEMPMSGGSKLCELAPNHQTAHRCGAWSWDNKESGAKAEDEPHQWTAHHDTVYGSACGR